MEIDRAGAVAVGFDPTLIHYPRPKGRLPRGDLGDGTRLGLASVRLDEGNVEATTRFGKAIRFPLTELCATRIPGRARWSTSPNGRPRGAI